MTNTHTTKPKDSTLFCVVIREQIHKYEHSGQMWTNMLRESHHSQSIDYNDNVNGIGREREKKKKTDIQMNALILHILNIYYSCFKIKLKSSIYQISNSVMQCAISTSLLFYCYRFSFSYSSFPFFVFILFCFIRILSLFNVWKFQVKCEWRCGRFRWLKIQ